MNIIDKKKVRKVFPLIAVGFILLTLGVNVRATEDETEILNKNDYEHIIMPFGMECGGGSIGGGTGANLNGWLNINGGRYFFVNGVRRTGWFQQNSAWFFLNPPAGTSGHNRNHTIGRMQTGWLQRGSSWYFLNPAAGTSGHNTREDVGKMQRGWLQRGSAWYFLNPAAGSAGHNPNRAYGRMLTGWVSRNGNYYFLNPAAGTAGHNPNQAYGRMQVGWLQRGSNRFFLNASGRMQTAWVNYRNNYYFLNPASGVAGHDRNRSHGAMLTGWLSRNSNWYFLDTTSGRMQRGWLRTGGDWFFLNNSGRMQTGTITLNGFSYQLNNSGRLQGNGTRTWRAVPANIDHTTINVTASGVWSVGSNVSWLTTSNIFPASRNGNGSFRINSTGANTTLSRRSGAITITAPGEPPRTINVTQERVIWHSDDDYNRVGFWPGPINVYSETFGQLSNSFQFHTFVSASRAHWTSALGLPIGRGYSRNHADVWAIGGPRATINHIWGGRFNRRWAGYAFHAASDPVGTLTVYKQARSVRRFRGQTRMYVIQDSYSHNWGQLMTREAQMVTTHELGHVLGYFGHAPNELYVMYEHVTRNFTLQDREIRHLRQIYDSFR